MAKDSHKRSLLGAVFVLIVVAGIAFFAEQYYRFRVCNFVSRDGEEHGFYMRPGRSVDSLIAIIEQDYEIQSHLDWRLHVAYMHFTEAKVGYYRLPARIGDKQLIRIFQKGYQSPIRLSFTNQIRNCEQLAGRMGEALLLDSAEVMARLDSVDYLRQFGLNRATAVCLFIPNTYEVYWTISPDDLFARMNKEYKAFWTEERLSKAKAKGLTPVQVATLASIVESETYKAAEHPQIASLYLNRLRKGMPLQACPTVIFANGDFSLRRVLKRHLALDSPYNTYKYAGLPPGPIRCAYGRTMDAVLNAPKTDYLYMCANPDWSGTHVFSSTYSQHAATARAYRQELNKRHIQ